MRLGSLCTGYGGLDMAAHALVPDAELVFVSDNDKHVSRFLDARFPDVPNLGDFTQLDRLPDCDILTAGFPCQPVSSAGKRKGTDDDRWLWDDIERVLGAMVRPPGLLLLENVRGLLSANGGDAMARVVEGLAGLGYVGRYRVLAASDIGAPHRRERVLIVAAHGDRAASDPEDADGRATTGKRRHPSGEHLVSTQWAEGRGVGVRHSASAVLPTPTVKQGRNATAGRRPDAKFNSGITLQDVAYTGRFGPYAAAVARWEQILGRPAPNPTVASNPAGAGNRGQASDAGHEGWGDPDARQSEMVRRRDGQADAEGAVPGDRPAADSEHSRRNTTSPGSQVASGEGKRQGRSVQPSGSGAVRPGRRLNPRFVEWMMGLPDGWVTDPDLGLSRTAQLKMLGNGVVPQQAYAAYRSLL